MDLLAQVDALEEAEPGYLERVERHAVAAARYDLGAIRLVSFGLFVASTAPFVIIAIAASWWMGVVAAYLLMRYCIDVYARKRLLAEGFRQARRALYALDPIILWGALKAKRAMLPIVWEALRASRPTVASTDRRTVTLAIVRLLNERLLAACVAPLLPGLKFE